MNFIPKHILIIFQLFRPQLSRPFIENFIKLMYIQPPPKHPVRSSPNKSPIPMNLQTMMDIHFQHRDNLNIINHPKNAIPLPRFRALASKRPPLGGFRWSSCMEFWPFTRGKRMSVFHFAGVSRLVEQLVESVRDRWRADCLFLDDFVAIGLWPLCPRPFELVVGFVVSHCRRRATCAE
jgi:hypothetical protein